MKLITDNHGFEGDLPEERIDMTIENSAKMFSILSDGIYKDKILAVIREYICNAFDAHVSVGKRDVPFTVRLPSYLDTTFSVTDEGTGVDPAEIGKIFWTYGRSTKTEDEETIGALGLGSKSAFAYTKSSFIVKNRFKGIEYTYFCFINEKGTPQGSKVGEEATTDSDGVTVEFAVRPEDTYAFYKRYARIYKYWANVKPLVIGVDVNDLDLAEPVKVVDGKGWFLENVENSYDRHSALAIMGNVAYPIESGSIPNLPASLKVIADNAFIITFPLGALEFAASRESLSYTEFTCKQLINRLEAVRAELADSFYQKVFAASKDHLSLYYEFAKTFKEFRKVVGIKSNGGSEEQENAYTRLLLDKDTDEKIDFQGVSFYIKDLINGTYRFKRDLYQDFGLYSAASRGRSHRYFLESATALTVSSIEETSAHELFISSSSYDYTIHAGEEVISNHDWRPNLISKKRAKTEPSMFDQFLSNIEKFDIYTVNHFKVDSHYKSLVFIINDVGGTGRDRFKAIVTNHTVLATEKLNDAQIVFVEFNEKLCSVDDVNLDLASVIKSSLVGSVVKRLSDLPDARAPIAKVKLDKESLKLNVATYHIGNPIDMSVGDAYFDVNAPRIKVNHFDLKHEEKVVTLESLRACKEVFFVIKRRVRTKFFDDVGSLKESCYKNSFLMSLSSHLGMFNDAIVEQTYNVDERHHDANGNIVVTTVQKTRKILPILMINEGQHAYLLKKGVKLTAISSLISGKIVKMEEDEKFIDVVSRIVTLSKVRHLKGMYDTFSSSSNLKLADGWNGSSSFFKSIFAEYRELRTNSSKFALAFAKLDVFNLIGAKHTFVNYEQNAKDIQDQIDAQYQMLTYVGYGSVYDKGVKLKAMISYIEQVDSLIQKAVIEAEAEVETV